MAIRNAPKNGSTHAGAKVGETGRRDLISLSMAPVRQGLTIYAEINRSLLDTFFRFIPWGMSPFGAVSERNGLPSAAAVEPVNAAETKTPKRAETPPPSNARRPPSARPKSRGHQTPSDHQAPGRQPITKRPATTKRPTATKRPAAAKARHQVAGHHQAPRPHRRHQAAGRAADTAPHQGPERRPEADGENSLEVDSQERGTCEALLGQEGGVEPTPARSG